MIQRASASFLTDDEAARALRAQTAAEVSSGKAEWTTWPPTLCNAVLSPRFGVDQGWKVKGDALVRKVRTVDAFHASRVNEATRVSECICHDTLVGRARGNRAGHLGRDTW